MMKKTVGLCLSLIVMVSAYAQTIKCSPTNKVMYRANSGMELKIKNEANSLEFYQYDNFLGEKHALTGKYEAIQMEEKMEIDPTNLYLKTGNGLFSRMVKVPTEKALTNKYLWVLKENMMYGISLNNNEELVTYLNDRRKQESIPEK